MIEHGGSRAFTVDYVGNSSAVQAGQLGRVPRADLTIGLEGRINYSGIISASGVSGNFNIDRRISDSQPLATQNYKLETRFDAPAAVPGTSQVATGGDIVNLTGLDGVLQVV